MRLDAPCPFCGYAQCETYADEETLPILLAISYYGECPNCAARGPWTTWLHERAAYLWNRRTP